MNGPKEKVDTQYPALEHWLDTATHGVGTLGKTRIRKEIGAHFQETYEAALAEGAAPLRAERQAVEALGDPRKARRGFRRAYLTFGEERHVRSKTGTVERFAWLHALDGWPFFALSAAAVAVTFFWSGFITALDLILVSFFSIWALLGLDQVLVRTMRKRNMHARYFRWQALLLAPSYLVYMVFMWAILSRTDETMLCLTMFAVSLLLSARLPLSVWRKTRKLSASDWEWLERAADG